MAYRDVYKMTDEQLSGMLFDELYSSEGIRRKQLIEKCVGRLGFTPRQLGDRTTASPVIRAKSRIGMVLTACLKAGYIVESETGVLELVGTGKRFISRERARDYVISQLEEHGSLTRKQLYANAGRDFGAERTPDKKDDNDLRAILGKALQRLVEEKNVLKSGSTYRLATDQRYPNTEMGSCLRDAAHGGDLETCFLKAIHIRGGEWFESYCVELLSSYYLSTGKTVLSAAVTGGSDDGGIDGIIKTEDWLGYRETVLMQMKNRHAIICAKDVREFYGAVCAENGSRGLFITISTFHQAAQELLNRVDNLIGIDGDKLFAIACQCGKGIIQRNGENVIDDALFLAE